MDINAKYLLMCYCFQDNMAVEDKVREVKKIFPCLSGIYEQDLKILFEGREYLPVIKGVEFATKFSDNGLSYIAITEIANITDMQRKSEVQKALMRICGCIGGFQYKKWGIGGPNDTIKKHLGQYLSEHAKNWIRGEEAGYPRVLEMSGEIVGNAPNESYTVTEITGIRID